MRMQTRCRWAEARLLSTVEASTRTRRQQEAAIAGKRCAAGGYQKKRLSRLERKLGCRAATDGQTEGCSVRCGAVMMTVAARHDWGATLLSRRACEMVLISGRSHEIDPNTNERNPAAQGERAASKAAVKAAAKPLDRGVVVGANRQFFSFSEMADFEPLSLSLSLSLSLARRPRGRSEGSDSGTIGSNSGTHARAR
ncbi:hypothetical protein L1887_51893 [Cichorium endivia]|nr:hypothetical protein L1887_51893 [Cichorium endivia]